MNANMTGPNHRAFGVGVFLAIAAVLVASVLMDRQGAAAGPRLVTDTSDMASPSEFGGTDLPGGGRFYTRYAGDLCVEGDGLATITSVDAVDSRGGLEVSGFSVFRVPSTGLLGVVDGARRLGEIVDYYGGHEVAGSCEAGMADHIAVEFYKPEQSDAWASEFKVHYVIDGTPGTTRIWLGQALCERKGCNPFKV